MEQQENSTIEGEGLKILEAAFDKASNDREFIAFYLKNHAHNHLLSKEKMLKSLNIYDLKDYYKLGLCKFPQIVMEPNKPADLFSNKVKEIVDYIGCNQVALEFILIGN